MPKVAGTAPKRRELGNKSLAATGRPGRLRPGVFESSRFAGDLVRLRRSALRNSVAPREAWGLGCAA